jgi:hypothetical protein
MDQKEFEIASLPDKKFRFGKVSPVDFLAIQTQIDFDNFKKSKTVFLFILEHTETLVADKWVPVKKEGFEAYMPAGIDSNLKALNEICDVVFNDVILPTFTKSGE